MELKKMSVTIGWYMRQVLVRNRKHFLYLRKVINTLAVKQKAITILELIRARESRLQEKL